MSSTERAIQSEFNRARSTKVGRRSESDSERGRHREGLDSEAERNKAERGKTEIDAKKAMPGETGGTRRNEPGHRLPPNEYILHMYSYMLPLTFYVHYVHKYP